MRVVWLRTALRNLDETAAYIARDNPGAASRIVERLRQAAERLARYPNSGRPGRVAGTRELIVPGLSLILPYRVLRRRIEILRGLHAARRWPESLP